MSLTADTVIRISNLGKEYRLGSVERRGHTLYEMIGGLLTAPLQRFRSLRGSAPEQDRLWALRDINLDIRAGEAIGIIGRNGAGKSTLLKVLSRITSPTQGSVTIRGRVASLLEVGTGFHPELTGRENIYLNGAILGMTRREINRQFKSIVEFAEVERFLDTPVKRYSSGMYVRLAFSVAAHMEPDVLLVDEVLAVGDHEFRKRCLGKMQDVAGQGRTILFVSHNMGTITSLCQRGVMLDRGRCVFVGSSEDAVRFYLESAQTEKRALDPGNFRGPLRRSVCFQRLTINHNAIDGNLVFAPTEDLVIEVHGDCRIAINEFSILFSIFQHGNRIFSLPDSRFGTPLKEGSFCSRVKIPAAFLRPGTFTLGIGGERKGGHHWLWCEDVVQFTIMEQWGDGYEERQYGAVNLNLIGRREQRNGGVR